MPTITTWLWVTACLFLLGALFAHLPFKSYVEDGTEVKAPAGCATAARWFCLIAGLVCGALALFGTLNR